MIKVVICGAFGRMGTTIGGIISKEKDMQLVGGVDIKEGTFFDAPVVTSDKLSDLISSVKPDVVIDFTISMTAAINVPVAARAGFQGKVRRGFPVRP